MQTALLLLCDIPRTIQNIRKDIDSFKKIPTHITLAYLKNDYDESDVIKILEKVKRFDITLNDISCDKDHAALYPNSKSTTELNSIASKIKKYIDKQPSNGYHLSIAYSKDKWNVYQSEDICTQINNKIDLPIDVRIKEMWIIKKDTERKGEWFKISAIKLKSPNIKPTIHVQGDGIGPITGARRGSKKSDIGSMAIDKGAKKDGKTGDKSRRGSKKLKS